MTSTKIFNIFKGSFVYVLTRTLRSSVGKQTAPVICEGFLLDEDEEFFFFGTTPEEVTDAIKRSEVVRIFLPIEELTGILEAHGHSNNEDMN